MAKTTEEDLGQLEKDIRQLKIEYEQYFGGGRNRPPTELEWRIDATMKRYSDRGGEMNFGQRYRYGNLAQMYSKYREIWRKRVRRKEEGSVQRHYGAAAREIEQERARKLAAERPVAAKEEFPFAISCKDPASEQTKVQELYKAFQHAKEKTGDSMEGLTIESFKEFVLQKTDQLKQEKNAHEIEYVVTLEDNHAKLKMRVKS